MAQIKIMDTSGTRSHSWAIFLRILLGVILFWKAINFVLDTGARELFFGNGYEGFLTKDDAVFILVFSIITMFCAIFITAGVFTKIAALIQLLIFTLGILFIHGGYVEREGFELFLTFIVPFLLLVFVTKGNHAFGK